MLIVVSLLACEPPDATPAPACEECLLTDAHSYTYTSALSATSTPLRAGADATVGWGGLTTDIRGRPVDPATGVEDAALLVFHRLSQDEVLAALSADELDQEEIAGYFLCESETAACALSEFCLAYACLDPAAWFDASRGTWLVALRAPGEAGALSLQFLVPDPASDADAASFTDTSASLALDVDLRAPVRVAAGADVTVDWSGLTRNGQGGDLDLNRVDRLQVARFDEDPATLERDFARVDALAEASWTLDVGGWRSASFSELDGFTGVTDEGTWLLALLCSGCQSPFPAAVVTLRR